MNKDESKQILDYLKRIDESINGPRPQERPAKTKRTVSDRLESVETKVGTLETKVGTLETKVGRLETKMDRRFDKVDRDIKSARVQVVDLVERVHEELARRVVDLELPGPGRKGNGGRGSGGGGVPLAS
jgi:polyhydroxyalkanoate synthesis regulator phasin